MRGLTDKQRKWLAAYIGPANGNATEAAKMAGYAGSRVTLAQIGPKTRRVPRVAAEIKANDWQYAEFEREHAARLRRIGRIGW